MLAEIPVFAAALLLGPPVRDWRPAELTVKEPPPLRDFEPLKDIAFRYLGRPYVTGGVGSPGFDCSGYVCRVYAEAGHALPRVSRDQANAGVPVPLDALAPGDLLFFAAPGQRISHVGIYLGDGEIVHASSGQGEVAVADLDAVWFRERLVGARRVLTSTVTEPFEPEPLLELVEHQGDTALPAMLRLPARRPPPSFGPELAGSNVSSLGVRSALITEEGVLGLTLAPEAALYLESVALLVSIAVPVRLEIGRSPTVGALDRFADYTRFLRSLSLGLRGADLDLRLTRFGDATLLSGFVLDRLAPGTAVRAIPGLSVQRSPLSFFAHGRIEGFEAEAMIDDAVDPGVLGTSVRAALPEMPLALGAAFSTDQRAVFQASRRAVSAVETEISSPLIATLDWSLDLTLGSGVISALERSGFGGTLGASLEHRFGSEAAVSLSMSGAVLGARFVRGLFGPTYVAAREAHLSALAETDTRGEIGAELAIRVRRFTLAASYSDAPGGFPIDRQVRGLLEVGRLPIGGTRLLDLRIAYAARALFSERPIAEGAMADGPDVLHAAARIRFASWLYGELYAQKGERLEGGAGLTVTWIP